MFDLRRAWPFGLLLWLISAATSVAQAQDGSPAIGFLESSTSLMLQPATALPEVLLNQPVRRIELVTSGGRWVSEEPLDKNLLGQPLTAAFARKVMRSILSSGRYAEISAEALARKDGVVLRVTVVPRRVVTELRVTGSALGDTPTLEAAEIEVGDEITLASLSAIDQRVTDLYRHRGFHQAYVRTVAIDTNDMMGIVLVIGVHAGPEAIVSRRRFKLDRPNSPRLQTLLQDYRVMATERADEVQLAEADAALRKELQSHRFPKASVTHDVTSNPEGFLLTVNVKSRAETHLRFRGNFSFDGDTLRAFLMENLSSLRGATSRAERLKEFYFKRGFLDADVAVKLRNLNSPAQLHSIFTIREGERINVRRRRFPCLTGMRSEQELTDEIDSFLAESLPANSLFGPVDPNELDRRISSGKSLGWRASPLILDPYLTFHRATYDKALAHLTALYRSEGYLSAVAGPLRVVRRTCDPQSPVGQCRIVPAPLPPSINCRLDAEPLRNNTPAFSGPSSDSPSGLPIECVADPRQGIRCENSVDLEIPIVLGPRALLWDIRFEGNQHLLESQLAAAASLPLGSPVSQLSLEEARRRLINRYEEDGYAFAGVEASIELSPDRSRGRALFRISERLPVMVRDIVIRGARFTSEQLIRSRIALHTGQLYRRSQARSTESQVIRLGVFTSVTVGLEDSEVPARDKVVVVEVQERLPQYLDVRPGFSSGQGLRVSFEYGHRNLLRRAVQLSFRMQLGYLPPQLIIGALQDQFTALQEKESLKFLLQHRLSLTLGLPEMGWGPAYRLDLEGLNVRDIFQQFARDKTALIGTLSRSTDRRFRIFGGASLEFNEADVYVNVLNAGGADATALRDFREKNEGSSALLSLLNIPEGLTFAVAQRAGFTWDRRDSAVSATRGTLLTFSLEHVDAYPLELSGRAGDSNSQSKLKSHFLRYSGRVGAYIPLNSHGLTLATSFRWGFNQQLVRGSETYPDRLFFLGGVDSLRGFNPRTVVPADVQREIDSQDRVEPSIDEEAISATMTDEAPSEEGMTMGPTPDDNGIDRVKGEVVRGGNLLLNPRAELRIPLFGIWNTVLFLDTGNLWVKPRAAWEQFDLRYTVGTGLRATTPVGPLAIDLGYNLAPRSQEERDSPFAVHFSIGLY